MTYALSIRRFPAVDKFTVASALRPLLPGLAAEKLTDLSADVSCLPAGSDSN